MPLKGCDVNHSIKLRLTTCRRARANTHTHRDNPPPHENLLLSIPTESLRNDWKKWKTLKQRGNPCNQKKRNSPKNKERKDRGLSYLLLKGFFLFLFTKESLPQEVPPAQAEVPPAEAAAQAGAVGLSNAGGTESAGGTDGAGGTEGAGGLA